MPTSSKIIDGKAFANELRTKLKLQVAQLQLNENITPGLAVILVGEDPASQVYVANKQKQAIECGFNSFEYKLNACSSEDALLTLIDDLNNRSDVHGILVQLPLPSHFNTENILNHIDPKKDVDGFHPINVGKLSVGEPALVPCTPLGCILLLKAFVGDLSGKHAVVIGRSNIVGKPMMQLLLAQNCTVTVVHSRTKNIEAIVANGDIVIAAIGRPQFIKSNWLKKDAVVIDVGINRIQINGKNKLVGDVDYDECYEKIALITPVPGGVGPMTIACLLQNTLSAACKLHGIQDPNGLTL